jgi:transposase InsO family protein
LSHDIPILVGIDTHAEVDLVDIKLVQQLGLKPCRNTDLPILRAINQQNLHTFGAYNVRLELTDTYGVRKTTLRPYLAVNRDPGDSQILLGMTALNEMRILVDCETYQWQYKMDKTCIKIESFQRFQKRAKGAKVYALVEVNHLIASKSALAGTLPESLQPYLDVFSSNNAKKLAPHRDIDLAIELIPGKEPTYGPIYPLSQTELAALREFLEENLAKGFIRESKSPAGAPILFAPKKDGGLRLCVDYRNLNAITVKNRYPLPLISEIMDRVTGAQYFSKIDLKDAYYRLRIKAGDEWKTAFRTRYGHYEFMVVPMGLTNAPATFQAYINKALRGLVDDFCIVYLDDILVFSRTREEHDQHLQQVCQRLREAELYAKPSKCQFYCHEIEFLGFIITSQGIRMDPERIRTIKEWENHPPKTYRDLQVLLGFCNFYRRFIKGYSSIARPLTSLFKGSQNGRKSGDFKQVWKVLQQEAFLALLGAFQTAPLLRHYDPTLPIRIETDASDAALGGVLSQLQGDTQKWHPIAFFSKQFKGAEANYSTPDKELMAIIECFKHWRHYLEGSQHTIEVWSDHQNLQGFMRQPKINGRQARWLVYLTPYDFIIRHRPGLQNPADGPSRRPDYMAAAQEEPSQVQKDLLARRLAGSDLQEARQPCEMARCQLCEAARVNPDYRWRNAPCSELPEAGRCDMAPERATALSPLMGQRVSGFEDDFTVLRRDAVGLRTPVATVQVLCAMPMEAEDSEVGRLIQLVRLQAVTRREARKAAQNENPLADKTANDLLASIYKLQGTDPLCLRLKKELGTKTRQGSEMDPQEVLRINTARQGYELDPQEVLRYNGRVVVPAQKALIQELLYLYHDDQFAGHWGIEKTKELLERKFYWPGLAQDIREYIITCPTCQNTAIPRHKPYGKLEPLPVPSRPWAEVSLDFITQLPVSYIGTKEYDAVLVVVDRYSKMARFIPTTTDITAPELAALFHENIELRYGAPIGVVSDRDSRITSKFWAEMCAYSLIKRRLSTAYHPQTDGQTEILNRILENYLRSYASIEQKNWAILLPSAEYAYNNSRSSSTKITPFMALYGYNPELRFDVEDTATKGEAPAAKDRIIRLHELRDKLRDELLRSQERQAKYYNQRHLPKLFKRDELVKLSTKNLKLKDKKLQPKWIGPLKVLERIGSQAYRLALPEKYDQLHDVFPVQLIEEFKSRGNQPLMPLPDLEEDSEFEIEEVKDKALIQGQTHYLVKWEGWPTEYNQWVPEEDMANASKLVLRFEKQQQKKQAKKKPPKA